MELSSPFSHPENTWKQSWHSNFCICWFWYLGWYHYTIWVRGGLSNEQGCWVRLSWVSWDLTQPIKSKMNLSFNKKFSQKNGPSLAHLQSKFGDDWVAILLSASISRLLGKMLYRARAKFCELSQWLKSSLTWVEKMGLMFYQTDLSK